MKAKKLRIGKNIKILRSKSNLTQEEMANQLNVTRQCISKWENNKGGVDLDTISRIHLLFNIPLEELLYGKGDYIHEIDQINIVNDQYEEERRMSFINRICSKGYYDIIDEYILEYQPLIVIDFSRIMAIVLALKERCYMITSVFSNGFGIYLVSDEQAAEFKKDIINIIDGFIHGDGNQAVKEFYEYSQNVVSIAEGSVIENVMKKLFGDEINFYWIDENEEIRGYGKDKKECIKQAEIQNCSIYSIFEEN